jgi:hypothetical protein
MEDRYLPATVNGKLDHMVEEIGEVLKAFGKIQRFGMDSYHPKRPPGHPDYETNCVTLLRELRDLEHAIDAVRFALEID